MQAEYFTLRCALLLFSVVILCRCSLFAVRCSMLMDRSNVGAATLQKVSVAQVGVETVSEDVWGELMLRGSTLRLIVGLLLAFVLTSCQTWSHQLESPDIRLESMQVLPARGLTPRFSIALRVKNPNGVMLPLQGLSYRVDVEGEALLSGVKNDLPTIPGYGEALISLEVDADLVSGLRLVTRMLSQPSRHIEYLLSATLNMGAFAPEIRLHEKGRLPLFGLESSAQ